MNGNTNGIPPYSTTEVGFSDSLLLSVSLAGFAALIYFIYSIILSKLKTTEELEEEEAHDLDFEERLVRSDPSKLGRTERRARARFIAKRALRESSSSAPAAPPTNLHDINPVERSQGPTASLISRKERVKLVKETEMRERHAMEMERKRQQQLRLEKDQRLKKEKEASKEMQKQQERLRVEHQRKIEWETFLSSRTKTISVEDWTKGVQNFPRIDMDKVAREFRLPFRLVQERIRQLIKEERLRGVILGDEFIPLSEKLLKLLGEKVHEQNQPVNPRQLELILEQTIKSVEM